jgi:hypothetical protein
MTISLHTPGPWNDDGQFIVAKDPNGKHPDIYIAEIAEQDSEGRVASPDQQVANASLIASAPDLFDALEYFFNIMHDYKCSVRKGYVKIAFQKAREALARAKGGAI